jgi:nicotinate-nucleotide pyrophosphorylase
MSATNTLAQLEEALAVDVDTVPLDNMSVDDLKHGVA